MQAWLKYGYSVYYIEYLKQCIQGRIEQEYGNDADKGIDKIAREYGNTRDEVIKDILTA